MGEMIVRRGFLIYHVLLARCAAVRFPSPWDFLLAGSDCRYPVACPTAVLDGLRRTFSIEILDSAGILERTAHGDLRLLSKLCNPCGAIVGLRDHPRHWPFGLITARGVIGGNRSLIDAQLADATTRQGLLGSGLLFASFSVLEVALLRSLGFAAILCPPFHRLGADDWKTLNQCLAGRDYIPTVESPGTSIDSAKPALVLLAWSPLTATGHISPRLRNAVHSLTLARKHLGLPLAGISLWQPSLQALENLRYRLAFRNTEAIREWVLESATDLRHFSSCELQGSEVGASDTVNQFLAVSAELQRCLAADRDLSYITPRTRQATENYRAVVRRCLTDPLRAWALERHDPMVKNAGTELASVCELVHQLSPVLHELQGRALESLLQGGPDLLPPSLLTQFLRLNACSSSLLRELKR